MKFKVIILGVISLAFGCTENTKLPTVITSPITEVTWEYAATGGEVIDDGGSPVTKRGVCATEDESNPPFIDDYGTWYTIDSSGIGIFSSKIAVRWHGAAYNLRNTHYVRAYATNSAGTAYGEVLSFYPGDKPISESSFRINTIITTSTSAVVNFDYYYPIYTTVREAGFCYGTGQSPSIEGDHTLLSSISDGSDSVTIENLSPNTEYNIRGYEQNQAGIVYSTQKTFTTAN